MIDSANIKVTSGSGGNGAISGRHERYVPKGGPDGGDGGDGGSIIVYAKESVTTLSDYRYKRIFKANRGFDGLSNKRHGASSKDKRLAVPLGTIVKREDGSIIADLDSNGSEVVVAVGGKGGKGNVKFKSPIYQFPVIAEAGELGQNVEINLELKLLADVALIGSPNAGKSSLLSAVTSAKPKIGNYPFTTIAPVLGVVERTVKEFVMVDIPGLIEGANEGAGLGDEFLRHAERTKMFLHILDINIGEPSKIVAEYEKVREEIRLYKEELSERPEIIVVNKIDLEIEKGKIENAVNLLKGYGKKVVEISATEKLGLEKMLDYIELELEVGNEKSYGIRTGNDETPVIKARELTSEKKVEKTKSKYKVIYSKAIRISRMIDNNNWTAKMQLYEMLKRWGVIEALEQSGLERGGKFSVGEIDFEWE
jgi:GTP-binding protein